MSQDLYSQIVNSAPGGFVAKRVGLPQPTALDRYSPGQPVVDGEVLVGGAPGGRLFGAIAQTLKDADVSVATSLDGDVRNAAADAGLDASVFNPEAAGGRRFKGLVFDATGIKDSTELVELQKFFHPVASKVKSSGRVVVLGTPPDDTSSPREYTAQRALEGFTRSFGKEVGRGATVQLIYVAPKAENLIGSSLRFFLSPKSAYVSGQVAYVSKGEAVPADIDWELPLKGKRALVTGASRGIGAAIIETLARDGADVVGLDVPQLGEDLKKVTDALGGEAIELDITAEDAPATLAKYFKDGVDIVVHNAGVTRDRTLAKMPEDRWAGLMEINLSSEERINDALLAAGAINKGGRIIGVSSMAGIAGNRGQTNYATSKAGVIGMVKSMAPVLAKDGITINAVAPGFIETQMTAAMPIAVREPGRRLNSMNQGGLPVDVAETIAWYASAGSGGLTGNVVRVCGQMMLGA
ncbi:MAG: 3-oxoacyl-ACP reductase [Solirubrobacteraceae bacterium]|nr:3-oxoacyl-ACP reductase [Solirubrobacteraceae bacterium]